MGVIYYTSSVSDCEPGTVVVCKSLAIGEDVVTKSDAVKMCIHIKFKSGEKIFAIFVVPDPFDKFFAKRALSIVPKQ